MFQTQAVETIKTRILCSITLFSENGAICEIMWKNIAQPGRPQMIWGVHIARWIPKATNTLS